MAWTLDNHHADVSFAAKHLMVSTVRGRFSDVEADVHIDEDHPERSHVTARVKVASLSSGSADRDAHLKSADFFEVERYPEIVYESTDVRLEGDQLQIRGNLTIKGVTRPVALKGEFAGPVPTPWGGRSIGLELTGEIDREDWGLTWNVALEAGGVLVSRKVKINIAAEVLEAAAAAA